MLGGKNLNPKEERIGSLDVLRIVLCMFVITLHFNNSNGGAALVLTEGNFYNHEFALLNESFTICAVNVFIILSGYFLGKNQTRRLLKSLILIFSVIGYNSFFCLVRMVINREFSVGIYVRSLIPVNYFLWIYVAVYLLSPWINIIFENTSKKNLIFLLLMMFGVFSIYPSILDLYSGMTGTTINGISTISATDSGAGYTFVNFIFMYSIGAYFRKYNPRIERYKCMFGYIISSIIIYMTIHITMNGLYYSNTIVILAAVFLFLVFLKSNVTSSNNITMLSELTFQVFVIHGCMYDIWKIFNVEKLLTGNLALTIVGFFASVIMMYVCSVGVAMCGKIIVYPACGILKKYIRFSYEIQGEKEINEAGTY